MQRGLIGSYEITSIGGERVRAFVPAPLPPQPRLSLDGPLQQALESALLSLGTARRNLDAAAGPGAVPIRLRTQRGGALFAD